jgi:glutaminase
VNSTGLPFNSLAAIEQSPDGRTNPMVNSGAIATTSLVPGATAEAKWQLIHEGLSRFAGRELSVDTKMYESASETNHRNQSIARLLQSYERIYCDPAEAIDLYTRQCSLSVSASDLATMGATLADGGIVTVSPGKGGFGAFAPPLDRAGSSVRGQLAAAFLSRPLGMDLFVSAPVPGDRQL